MRKKLVVRMLCLAMAASMIGTMVPTSLYPVVAHALHKAGANILHFY